jgi:hypothetical protein
MAWKRSPEALARWKYQKHRALAKFRKIDFNFTYDEWFAWWMSHGVDKRLDIKWPGKDRPCMARKGDVGPYDINNVYFARNSDNARDSYTNGRNRVKVNHSIYPHRWGNEIITREKLILEYHVPPDRTQHFQAHRYDHFRKMEYKHLHLVYLQQYGTWRTRQRYVTPLGEFQTKKAACDALKIRPERFQLGLERGLYQQYSHGPDYNEWILSHSQYPDPVLEE